LFMVVLVWLICCFLCAIPACLISFDRDCECHRETFDRLLNM